MEKYDLAFNGWQTTKSFEELTPYNPSRCEEQDYDALYADSLGPAAQWASRHRGNWIAHDRVDSDGDGLEDECDDLDGMETWWDLDHAWAAAASVEEEPAEPVSVNGVNFWPSDVKALLLTVYDSSTSFILSGTCRASQLERNYKGLPLNKGCEGLDAGDFHVLLTNFVGRFQAAISEEVTENGRIVSRPIDSYSVELQRSIEADEAVALLGQESAGDGTYLLNPDARAWIEVEVSTQALVSSAPSQTGLLADVETFTTSRVHHYVLELDSEDRILGGQWVKDAKSQTSPDFLWIVQGPRFQRVVGDPEPELDAPSNPFVRYSEVLALLNQATGNSGGSDLEIATATP